jgi:ubiquinone biosynthesis protein
MINEPRSAFRMVQEWAARLDALSIDLARDAGLAARDARAFADTARDRAVGLFRATPRTAQLVRAAAALFARHRWLRIAAAATRGDPQLSPDDHRDLARRVTAHAARMRGGIAKLGQLASCRPDLVGPVWASELATLQDDVPPIDIVALRARVEAELGRPIGEAFADFDDAPIAAASLAQVHGATLHDGTRVVVKVQVPDIDAIVAADIAALRTIASAVGDIPGLDLDAIAAELARALAVELDYEAEAAALRRFAAQSGRALVPTPIAELSTARVLTMTRIDGERLGVYLEHAEPAARDRLLAELVDEVAQQILVRGLVHADPHPGNFLVASEAGTDRIAVLDFGCTLELSAAERKGYARLVLAIAARDRAAAARELAALGFVADDPEALVELASSFVGALAPGARLDELDWRAAFYDQLGRARELGALRVPRSFVLIGRVLAAIAGLLATHRPRLELHPIVARHLAAAIA